MLLDFFDLQCVKLYWGITTKHADHDTDLALGVIDLADRTVKAFERTIGDIDDFANRKVDEVLWIFDAHAFFDFADFTVVHRCWIGT